MSDTIFALATAPGRGAVAVVRVSGSNARASVEALAGRLPRPRAASLRALRDTDGALLDHALVLWFPGPASFTGEDCAEFQVHGGPAVVDGVTTALIAAGARLAQPGEFTRRAFGNGKLDLSQAEGVADLVDAETSSQARQALDQLGGSLGRRYAGWRERLIAALGLLEAAIDFPEEDTASQAARSAEPGLRALLAELEAALADAGRGRLVRDGYRIALIGAPNSGKSSIINALTADDTAIVSAIPGTTRDVIEAALDIAGYRVLLRDTAGLRESDDEIEAEGARRAGLAAESAALRFWVVDRAASDGDWRVSAPFLRRGDLCLLNKADLSEGADAEFARAEAERRGLEVIVVSTVSGDVRTVSAALERHLAKALAGAEFPAATRIRHVELLRDAAEGVSRALHKHADPELAAEDLRLAARAMERITGAIGAEDVLDRVFSTFCIGK